MCGYQLSCSWTQPFTYTDHYCIPVHVSACLSTNTNTTLTIHSSDSLLHIYYTVPITTCTAERSFSSLRWLKTYLQSTMTEERFNNVIILHVHKDDTDCLEIASISTSVNDRRMSFFGKCYLTAHALPRISRRGRMFIACASCWTKWYWVSGLQASMTLALTKCLPFHHL